MIGDNDFVGRAEKLKCIARILQPDQPTTEQRRLVLGGIGGIGKTQLAVAYARHHQRSHTSVFWLNATTEITLKATFRSLAQNIVQTRGLENLNDEQTVSRVHEWLCHGRNVGWLLILDNYDNPDHFRIDEYYPNTGHGFLMITSRLPD